MIYSLCLAWATFNLLVLTYICVFLMILNIGQLFNCVSRGTTVRSGSEEQVLRISGHISCNRCDQFRFFFPPFRYGPALMAHSELFVTRAPPVDVRTAELSALSFLDSFGDDNSTAERCYRSHSRSSVLQGLPFGGVPTVLAINVVLWMVQTHTHNNAPGLHY